MTISPSKLSTYETCPRQYEAKYITKEVRFQSNAHADFGNAVHKNIEDYLLGKGELAQRLIPMKEIFDKHAPKLIATERKMGMTVNGKPAPMYGNGSWINCITDAAYQSEDKSHILIIDWKTGKNREADIQADMNKIIVAAHHPEAKKIDTAFVHLFHGGIIHQEYVPGVTKLPQIYGKIMRLERATRERQFEPTPNGLCKAWCDVLSCPHNGKR